MRCIVFFFRIRPPPMSTRTETRLPYTMLFQSIKDPLTHMVRNSAAHGLEIPAERAKAGKPEIGTVSLNAFHEGGHIIIEIADDGKGLSVERIKAKCLDRKSTRLNSSH